MKNVVRCQTIVVAFVLISTFAWAPFCYAQPSPSRVEFRPICAYDFTEGNGRIIHDRSGHEDAIDLLIETPNSVRWSPGTLTVVSSASLVSQKSAKRLSEAVRKSNAISIEAWITPANTEQTGPARIVSLSSNASSRNFTLGQDKDFYDVRFKTTITDSNGLPSTAGPVKSLTSRLTHVVFTRDAMGLTVIFVNGEQVVSKIVGGDPGNWDAGHRLSLANEISRDRPWLGQFYFVAIYDRALSQSEAQQNFAAGSSPDMKLAAADDTYHKTIQPMLIAKCVKCHGPEKQKGGLRLDVRSAALKGGDSGDFAIVPGNSADSRLLKLIMSTDENERMPPEGEPLTAAQIHLIKKWIDFGADWPDDSATSKTGRNEMVVTDEDRQHWSFRPMQKITPPDVADKAWIRNPVDNFVRHAQEAKALSPATTANARTLIRRLYFDIIGLPPRLSEAGDQFHEQLLNVDIHPTAILTDPDAYAALVDHLLASSHFGERWARHWLDVARYADSNGQEGDADRPNAYRFRDFVVRSFNEDLPYNTFVRWQLAGDEIAPDNPLAIAATGFIVAGNSTILNVPMEEEKLRNRANELDDMVSTTSQAFLGLTLACARCHDHKYDPLPTRDYYRMMSAFNSGDRTDVPLAAPALVKSRSDEIDAWQRELNTAQKKRDDWLKSARQPIARQVLAAKVAKLSISDDEKTLLLEKPDDPAAKKLADKFKKALRIEDAEYVAALTADEQSQWKELDASVQAITRKKTESLPTGYAFADFASEPRETWLFERGDFLARNERLSLGFLTVMQRDKSADDYWNAARESRLRDDSSQQRHAMADWMADTEHGAGVLLARVIVNRVWQHHFGSGIVRTVSDFGTRGETPTHPELLEWLTNEFISHGWSLKHLHRLILNSATYRQGVSPNEANHTLDPENSFLWRRRPQRLESEVLRDSMLAVAGTLNSEMFGPSVKAPIPSEAMQARNVKDPYPQDLKDTVETRRRSIYMFHKRVVQYPLMLAFDAPDAQVSCGQRVNTTVAPQALAMLNDPFVRLRSEEFSQRLQREAGSDLNAQIKLAFQLGLARQPDEEEFSVAQAFLTGQAAARQLHDTKLAEEAATALALTDFCQMLFSFNEFIYVD
jgi:mono/diheme cytochrome c family protein